MANDQSAQRVINAVEEEELADLAVELGAIESPAGKEGPAALRVEEWLREAGFESRRIALLPERPAIVSRIHGAGGGPTLVFNAHLDTAVGRDDWLQYDDPAQRRYISAWREDGELFGNGLVNDKAPMAAFLIAAAAIKRTGTTLRGDLVLTAVPGEIGLEPMDEFEAPTHVGKDLGTRYAIAHGAVGDGALVAEATGNAIASVMAGKAYFKITVLGGEPLYTPFVPRTTEMADHPNAIVRASLVIAALNEWAAQYGEREYRCAGGVVAPRANIGAIRGGRVDLITKSSQVAFLYVDVRLSPDASVMDVQREVESCLEATGLPVRVECCLYRRGYEAVGIEPLSAAVRQAHEEEFGSAPPSAVPGVTSMWRDINPYNEAGIPSLTYGPASSTGGGNYSVRVDELAATARVYARTALHYCGVVEE